MNRSLWLPVAAVLGGAALGASSGLYIKGVGLSGLALAAFRMGIPFLVVLPFVLKRGAGLGLKEQRRGLWTASGLNAVRMLLFILAYKLTAIGNAVVLLYLWPVFALVFGCLRDRRLPTGGQAGILALAFGGVVVMNLHRDFSAARNDLLGSGFMIVSAALFAVTALLFKNALAQVKETDTLYFQNGVGALVFLPFAVMEVPSTPLPEVGLALVYGLVVGFVAFGIFFYAMKRLPLFQYSALAYSEVVFGVLLGVVVLGETLTANQLAGAALILSASVLAQKVSSGRGSPGEAGPPSHR